MVKKSFTRIRRRSFTLIEVLAAIIIIGIVSSGSYLAFVILSRLGEYTRSRAMAINLSQMSLEEIIAHAQDNFDNLESYSFTSVPIEFSGFTRSFSVSLEKGSTELKRVQITVSWNERGILKSDNHVILISRPREPLPGNIKGKVTSIDTGVPIRNVSIVVEYVTNPTQSLTTSSDSFGNYNLVDSKTGSFRLKPGEWNLSAGCNGYYDYTRSSLISVSSGKEEEVNFSLTPKPIDAVIKGTVVKKESGGSFKQYVSLYHKGSYVNNNGGAAGTFNFTIKFEDTNPRCFTIITSSKEDSSTYPYRYNNNQRCGDFCDPHGWGKSYNYRGWSSAVVQADNSKICSNPWLGSAVTDRLCVNPGDLLDLGSIGLADIPRAVLSGYVYNNVGEPVKSASVQIIWHDNASYAAVNTDGNGHYEVSVPAEQDLFPDSIAYYLQVRAYADISIVGCCNNPSTQRVYSGWQKIGPLYQGDSVNRDFNLPAGSNNVCGNVNGIVIDGQTSGALMGVSVGIKGRVNTDAAGYYEFKCQPGYEAYFCIPQGVYAVEAKKTGYYDFISTGNNYYSNRGKISITGNSTVSFENIKLWPMGKGNIHGRVVTAGLKTPIDGAKVKVDTYIDFYDQTVVTDAEGKFVFINRVESWPPLSVLGNGYYNQTVRNHSIDVTYTEQYYPKTVGGILLKSGEDLDLGDISLVQKGQM